MRLPAKDEGRRQVPGFDSDLLRGEPRVIDNSTRSAPEPFASTTAQAALRDAPAASAEARAAQQPPSLLVVEDDADDFMLLKRALYKSGATARVWWARDVREAIVILGELDQAQCRICVVVDLRLGGVEGWDLVTRIKTGPSALRIKCALLTGMTDVRTRDRAETEGADALFIKPCDAAGLVEIARALQRLASS